MFGILLGAMLAACVAPAGATVPSGGLSSNPPVAPSGGGTVGGGTVGGGAPGAGGDGIVSSSPSLGSGGIAVGPVGGGGPSAQPTIVAPQPNRLDVRQVAATALEPTVDGRRLVVKVSWWSGVAPCNVLDSVGVSRTGSAFALTIREGSDRLGVACIEIAMFKATMVDLGNLAPGTYEVAAYGDLVPISVTVR